MKQQRIYLLNTDSGYLRQYIGESGEDAARRMVLRYPLETVIGYVLAPRLTRCDIRGVGASAEGKGDGNG